MARLAMIALLLCCSACGSMTSGFTSFEDASTTDAPGDDAPDAAVDGPTFGDASLDGGRCEPPDMLMVLDRSASMWRTLDGVIPPDTVVGRRRTKWGLAVAAVTRAVTPPRDTTVRFGLELFPRDPGGDLCPNLSGYIAGERPRNTICETGEILVSPAAGAGASIGSAITVDGTRLCLSTPITAAIKLAETELAKVRTAGRAQYVLLVTDGAETCATDVVPVLQALAGRGVRTFVVGFNSVASDAGAGVDLSALNDMACAGQTATGFATECVLAEGGGGYVAKSPTGRALFFDARSGAALAKALEDITGSICCGCVK
jgi:hypothetical protein